MVNGDDEKIGELTAGAPFVDEDPKEFAESVKRREQAADALEDDLLNDVPMMYGPPGATFLPPSPDPGIVLGRIHREDMLRKNGYDVSDASGTTSEVSLPFERSIGALLIVLMLIVLFTNMSHGH